MRLMNPPALKLKTKFRLLREIGIFLDMMVYFGLGGGIYSAIQDESIKAMLFATLMGVSFYTSSRLGWKVQELQIKMLLEENKRETMKKVGRR